MVASSDCSVSHEEEEEENETSDEELETWRPGMSAYCTFVLGGTFRAAHVIVVEPGVTQTVVAAPLDCTIAASGGFLAADGVCERGDQQSFQCSCIGSSDTCKVVFHTVSSEALLMNSLPECCDFGTDGGKRARPTTRSVVTTYYGKAEEKSYRIQTCSGDAVETKFYDEVRIADNSAAFLSNSVLLIPDFLTRAECQMLIDVAEQHMDAASVEVKPLNRLPTCDLGVDADAFVASVLQDRVLPFFEQELPHVAEKLFGRAVGLKGMEFSFSPNEPAVNRYITGGEFMVHHDAYSVTVNVLLSEPECFVGGGTAFWPQHQAEKTDTCTCAPVLVRPRRGTAVIFNGEVEHSGRQVESGIRHLFVASFHLS
eukprot:TRINITY_DN3392_c0_g1_i1.p1 TRINITY_DN3392_c0_g1~~TRINITY_DN3392_c0_g1_i1.p1  ORF type:complete len:370 (+),score=42.52 TRINITY_DN3392_c0_g1_i1:58-1167(+)